MTCHPPDHLPAGAEGEGEAALSGDANPQFQPAGIDLDEEVAEGRGC